MQPAADCKICWISHDCDQTVFRSPLIWMRSGGKTCMVPVSIDPISFALQIRLNFEVNDKKMFDKALYKVTPGLTANID